MSEKTNHVMQSIVDRKYPVVDRAEGMYIYDTEGNKYLDVASGVSVSNIGHGNKKVLAAMEEQMNKVTFVYAGHFTSDKRKELADKIIEIAPEGMDKVFFCSGGSEAIESVIKISRQYHLEKGNNSKYKIISRWLSYHGNTIGTLSVGGRRSWRYKYEPYLLQMPHISQCYCYRCPYGLSYPGCGLPCAAELERVISYEGPETVAAFLIEPIVGTTTAALMPPKEYIKEVRRICDKYDVLFCVDEVMTGFGRTGRAFAIDHFDVSPDIIGFAKGCASGYYPIGGAILHKKVSDAIANGTGELTHSHTFASNPVSCAAGCAVLDCYKENNLFERAEKMGKVFLEKIKTALADLTHVGEIRGVGMMFGIEIVKDKVTKEAYDFDQDASKRIMAYCFKKGVIINPGIPGVYDEGRWSGEAIQMAPPFIINEEEMDFAITILKEGILAICGN